MLLFYEEERRPRGDEIGDHAGDVLSALVLVWIVLALWIGREFQRRMARGGAWSPWQKCSWLLDPAPEKCL